MSHIMNDIDLDKLPKHLFVKSQKQAKKIVKQTITLYESSALYKPLKKFKLLIEN